MMSSYEKDGKDKLDFVMYKKNECKKELSRLWSTVNTWKLYQNERGAELLLVRR